MLSSRWASNSDQNPDPTPPLDANAAPVQAPEQVPPVQEPEPPETMLYSDGASYDPDVDEFAQTRAPDDLFDDDFTPMTEPIVEAEPPIPTPPARGVAPGARAGRGARRGGVGNAMPGAGRIRAPKSESQATTATNVEQNGSKAVTDGPEEQQQNEQDIPTAPAKQRAEAVRGDRSGTGGIKKAKLTEEELTARMEAMALKSSQLEAAHARAAADLASFEAREAEAAQRRKEDRQNRQQMMGERERNRQRKLQAQGGREWDFEKKDEDFAAERNSRPRRGVHGGVASSRYATAGATADDQDREEQRGDYFRGRGRGRGGRGRGRGNGAAASSRTENPAEQLPPTASDFPELPAATPAKNDDVAKPTTLEFPGKVAAKKQDNPTTSHIQSWADEVEGPMSPT